MCSKSDILVATKYLILVATKYGQTWNGVKIVYEREIDGEKIKKDSL